MSRNTAFPVFTIGHSLHGDDRFLSLLVRHSIDILLDVRSSPFSRRAPHFNRPSIKGRLANVGIVYSFAGRTLGGRPDDESLYEQGRVSYERMAVTRSFVAGVRRIAVAARSNRVALMCAESDPIECHRFLLIGRALQEKSVEVSHILPNGELEAHAAGEERLLRAVGLAQTGLFQETGDAISEAYARQTARVAFSPIVRDFELAWYKRP
jgi:uncharacterized protein (DUF488 family)